MGQGSLLQIYKKNADLATRNAPQNPSQIWGVTDFGIEKIRGYTGYQNFGAIFFGVKNLG